MTKTKSKITPAEARVTEHLPAKAAMAWEGLRELARSSSPSWNKADLAVESARLRAIGALGEALSAGVDPLELAEALANGHLLVEREANGKGTMSVIPDLLDSLTPAELSNLAFALPARVTLEDLDEMEREIDFQRSEGLANRETLA